MKTVPTLCATATAAGVSAVGLSLGRPEHTSRVAPVPRKISTNTDYNASQIPDVSVDVIDDTIPSVAAAVAAAATPAHLAASELHPTHNSLPRVRRRRRGIRADNSRQTVSDTEGDLPSLAEGEDDSFDQARPLRVRPSWSKRLSTLSSHNSSIASSPRAGSPSVSCSNGSTSFSHNGSIVPILGRRQPAPPPPNKLVKRSASLRLSEGTSPRQSSSLMPTLKRPATSHQRSATLQSRLHRASVSSDGSAISDGWTAGVHEESLQWRQYFTPRVVGATNIQRKRSSVGETKAIRRIIPDPTSYPTLVMATSVATASAEHDYTSSGPEDDSLYNSSRPATPPHAEGQPPGSGPFPLNGPNNSPAVGSPHSERPQRSFSISDLLSPSSSHWKSRNLGKSPPNRLLRRSSRRISSAPTASSIHNRVTYATKDQAHSSPLAQETSNGSHRKDLYSSPNEHIPILREQSPVLHRQSSPVQDSHNASHDSSLLAGERASISETLSKPSPSSSVIHVLHRPRLSMAASEPASTLVGSDNDVRGFASTDEETDYQSETPFDSQRTRVGRSASGMNGRHIATIFDESPPGSLEKIKVTALRDLLPGTTLSRPRGLRNHVSFTEAAPTFGITGGEDRNRTPTTPSDADSAFISAVSAVSSPGLDSPKALHLGNLPWHSPIENSGQWSVRSSDSDGSLDAAGRRAVDTPSQPPRSGLRSMLPPIVSPAHPDADRDAKGNLFDWSEPQPTERSPVYGTPPRPRTVHGKKDPEMRGSRSVGRRAPSGLHARSQSVPVVPDSTGKRQNVVTNKFGTWGVGSKGVTEDWGEDFDFPEPADLSDATNDVDHEPSSATGSVLVPKSIRDQQSKVLANIGLLREWGIVIEELKELRIRAASIGVVGGRHVEVWQKVDAMIELADQEADEEGFGMHISSSSSPGFNLDAFEDGERAVCRSLTPGQEDAHELHVVATPGSGRKRRKSILPSENNVFQSPLAVTAASTPNMQSTPERHTTPKTRPRQNSEAVARSVIDALQKRQSATDYSASLQAVPASKKVPFDTATLKHIVPYVNGLMRQVKHVVREAEALTSSADPDSPEAVSQLGPSDHNPEVALQTQSPFSDHAATSSFMDDGCAIKDTDMNTNIKLMAVV